MAFYFNLCQDVLVHFNWLLDPLHVGVRAIVSVGIDSCLELWRQLPTLHMEPLSLTSAEEILHTTTALHQIDVPKQWVRT